MRVGSLRSFLEGTETMGTCGPIKMMSEKHGPCIRPRKRCNSLTQILYKSGHLKLPWHGPTPTYHMKYGMIHLLLLLTQYKQTNIDIYLLIYKFLKIFMVIMYVMECMIHMHVEVKGQLWGLSPIFPPFFCFQRSKTSYLACMASPFTH